jgi:hypothetical protein
MIPDNLWLFPFNRRLKSPAKRKKHACFELNYSFKITMIEVATWTFLVVAFHLDDNFSRWRNGKQQYWID